MAKDLNDPPANENAPLPGEANLTHDIQAVESLILKPNSRTPRARLASGFNGDNIPDTLKANARWAPWKAVFNEKRQKFDKIPHQATAPFYRISTAHPDRWYSYEVALKAFQDNPTRFAGIGYVITGSHGVVGIDLDGCVNDNTIEEWALEVIKDLASYTELSPSGKGLRILVAGEIGRDWTNHERGIVVYGSHAPRFLTVTGQRLKISVLNMTRPDPRVLGELDGMYAKAESAPTAPDKEMPDLVEELLVADISQLGLPYKTSDFLADGTAGGDRSRTLFTAAIDLYKAGLADDMVVSVLAYNEHAMGVALSHRRYDHDRALAYLWDEHCVKAKAKVGDITPVIELFDNVSAPSLAVVPIAPTGETPAPAVPANRFEFQQFADYLDRKPISWIIKRILPQAEIGVVYGESTAGKTFFVLDLVMSVATGTPWKDRLVAQGTVAYICAEGAGGFALRMKAYAEHHDIDGTTVPLHVLAGAPNFLDKADIKDLVSSVKKLPNLLLIVVDTLAQVTASGNENSGEDMGRALSHCKTLHHVTGAMVLMVAHSGKDASKGIRGWSGIKGALDVELLVERAGDERSATITKMKDGSGEGEQHGFKLTTVSLGTEPDGEPINSCLLHHIAMVPKSQRKSEPKGPNQALTMRVAISLTDMPGLVTTTQLIDAAVNELSAPEGKRDQRRANLIRALESLVAANRISLVQAKVVVL